MAELIGVTTVPRNFKKRLLLFDRIAFPSANWFLGRWPLRKNDPAVANDLEWLMDRGLVFVPDVDAPSAIENLDTRTAIANLLTAYSSLPLFADEDGAQRVDCEAYGSCRLLASNGALEDVIAFRDNARQNVLSQSLRAWPLGSSPRWKFPTNWRISSPDTSGRSCWRR
jgi:hypothetical protein